MTIEEYIIKTIAEKRNLPNGSEVKLLGFAPHKAEYWSELTYESVKTEIQYQVISNPDSEPNTLYLDEEETVEFLQGLWNERAQKR